MNRRRRHSGASDYRTPRTRWPGPTSTLNQTEAKVKYADVGVRRRGRVLLQIRMRGINPRNPPDHHRHLNILPTLASVQCRMQQVDMQELLQPKAWETLFTWVGLFVRQLRDFRPVLFQTIQDSSVDLGKLVSGEFLKAAGNRSASLVLVPPGLVISLLEDITDSQIDGIV